MNTLMPPHQQGISKLRKVEGDEAGGPPLKRLKSGASLAELQQDYAMFSYAPLCLYGGLKFNPIQEWINLNNHSQIVFILRLEHSILNLRGLSTWNTLLWLVEKPYWESLRLHIGSMALVDHKQGHLMRVLCQDIPILDLNAINSITLKDVPTVSITIFSPDTNEACYAIEPTNHMLIEQPRLVRISPREETVKLATAIFKMSSEPYNDIQPYPWELNENNITRSS